MSYENTQSISDQRLLEEGVNDLFSKLNTREILYEGTMYSDAREAQRRLEEKGLENVTESDAIEYFTLLADYELGEFVRSDTEREDIGFYQRYMKTKNILEDPAGLVDALREALD